MDNETKVALIAGLIFLVSFLSLTLFILIYALPKALKAEKKDKEIRASGTKEQKIQKLNEKIKRYDRGKKWALLTILPLFLIWVSVSLFFEADLPIGVILLGVLPFLYFSAETKRIRAELDNLN